LYVFIIIFAEQNKANHNKDYSVVKTFKAAQVAFFYFATLKIKLTKKSNSFSIKANCFINKMGNDTKK